MTPSFPINGPASSGGRPWPPRAALKMVQLIPPSEKRRGGPEASAVLNSELPLVEAQASQ